MVRAKVNIETARKSYRPGEAIAEPLSETDLDYLKKRHFITIEDEEALVMDGCPAGAADAAPAMDWEGPESDGDGDALKDEAALSRMSKAEIVEYAEGVGLRLEESLLKTDLISAVLNYTEEKLGERE